VGVKRSRHHVFGRGVMYLVGVSCIWSVCHVFCRGVMYFVGVSCILSGCHVFSSISALFSFPVVPHKPVLLHQKCPDGPHSLRLPSGKRRIDSKKKKVP